MFFFSHYVCGNFFTAVIGNELSGASQMIFQEIKPFEEIVMKKILQSQIKSNYNYIASAKSLQSCPTLCDPIDGSPSGSPVPGILQARTLEWVAISFSNAWKWKVKVKLLSRVRLSVTPWATTYQAPSSMGFSRQEYWSGVPLPSLIITLNDV